MKNVIRLLTLLMAVLLMVSAVGCKPQVQTITSETWEEEEGGDNTDVTSTDGDTDNDNPDATTSKNPDTDGKVFDFKGSTISIHSWSSPAEPNKTSSTYKQEVKLVEELQKKYNCKFEYPCIIDSIEYYNAFVTQSMAGTKFADIVPVPGDQGFPSAALSGYARCLDGKFDFDSEMFIDRYVNDALLLKNKHYYLAFSLNMGGNAGGGIRFRKSVFTKFGVQTPHDYIKANNWTWDTFRDLCKTMTRNEGGTQYYGLESAKSAIWFASNNVEYVKKVGEGQYKFNLDTPEAIACIQFAKDLYDAGYAPKSNGSSLWDAGLVAMSSTTWYGLTGEDDVAYAYYPIGPNATDYVYQGGELGLTIVPTTVKDSIFDGICQVITDYYSVQPWRKTPEQYLESRHSDEYSLQLHVDTVMRASTANRWSTYYPWTYRNVIWTDYGISEGQSPQAFIDSVKDAAQAEIDSLWSGLDKLN